MPKTNAPIPIAEAIEKERNDLIHVYPWHGEQIVAYVEGVSQLINKTIQASSGQNAVSYLDEICSQLDFIEKHNLGGLPPEVQRYVTMARGLIRKQILSGAIELGKIAVKPKKKPIPSDDMVILAESES